MDAKIAGSAGVESRSQQELVAKQFAPHMGT